jgi:hypothetical protein
MLSFGDFSLWKMALLHLVAIAMGLSAGACPVAGQSRPSVGVAAMVLRPHGLEPAEIEIKLGRTLLAVYNRTGLEEIVLRVEREAGSGPPAGQLLHEERVPLGKRAARRLFDLVPGSYLVTEANHPAWKCRMIVKPN